MFPASTKFKAIACPKYPNCTRMYYCPFSHSNTKHNQGKKAIFVDEHTQTDVQRPRKLVKVVHSGMEEDTEQLNVLPLAGNPISANSIINNKGTVVPPTIRNVGRKTTTSSSSSNMNTPKILPDFNSRINRSVRQATLDKFHHQFQRIYSNIPNCSQLASDHSLQ